MRSEDQRSGVHHGSLQSMYYLLLCTKLLHTLAALNNNKHLLSHTVLTVVEFGSTLLLVLAHGLSLGHSY